MKFRASGVWVILIWLVLTWFISNSIFELITPKEVELSESLSCPKATYQECLESEIVPKTIEDIQNGLFNSLTQTQKTISIFNFPLGILEFEQVIENRDSKIVLLVSKPVYEKTVLSNAQITCNFRHNIFSLENKKRHYTKEYLQFYTFAGQDLDTAKKNTEEIAKYIASGYLGCDWVPEAIVFDPEQEEIKIAPNEIVSLVKIVRPFLIFKPVWSTTAIIYFGVFALLGAIIALLKQFIQILLSGFEFFVK